MNKLLSVTSSEHVKRDARSWRQLSVVDYIMLTTDTTY